MEIEKENAKESSKKKITPLIKIFVSFTVLAIIFRKVNFNEVINLLHSMKIGYFFLAVCIFIVIVFLGSIRWRLLISIDKSVYIPSAVKLFLLNLMGFFFNYILPGMIGGDAVKGYCIYKETKNIHLSVGSLFMDRYIGFMTLIFLGLLALPFGIGKIKGSGVEWAVPAITFISITASLFFFLFRIGNNLQPVKNIYEYFGKLRKSPKVILQAIFLSIIIHVLVITSAYLISIGMRAHISLLEFFLFLPIITTITAVPISISGLGLREGAFVILLGIIGVPSDMAVAISLGWYLSCIASTIPGVFIYIRWKGSGKNP
jgi:uncharacterized membrane protein YbhN (UPF0104 family)